MPTDDNAVARLVSAMARVAEHDFPLEPTESVAEMARQVG